MKTFIIVVAAVFVAYFVWARMDSKKRKIEREKKKDKPVFRSEGDLDEYAKPLADDHKGKVDFDDAE